MNNDDTRNASRAPAALQAHLAHLEELKAMAVAAFAENAEREQGETRPDRTILWVVNHTSVQRKFVRISGKERVTRVLCAHIVRAWDDPPQDVEGKCSEGFGRKWAEVFVKAFRRLAYDAEILGSTLDQAADEAVREADLYSVPLSAYRDD